MELYIIRHGQSEANARMRLAGWLDVPLSEKGVEDAREAGRKLGGIAFEKVYASDLKRACQTCENAMPGVEYEKTALLRELAAGEYEGFAYKDERGTENHARYMKHKDARDFSDCGGESHQDQLDRIGAFMDMVAQKHSGRVAAFTHAGALECVLHRVMGFRVPGRALVIPNCAVCVFEWNGERWKLKHWNI